MVDREDEVMGLAGWLRSNREDAKEFIRQAEEEGNLDDNGWKNAYEREEDRKEAFDIFLNDR